MKRTLVGLMAWIIGFSVFLTNVKAVYANSLGGERVARHESSSGVSAACIQMVAYKYGIPRAILLAIVKTEGGHAGSYRRNTNGSVDVGPMQINSRWFHTLRRYKITPNDLAQDACLNVDVGGWILYKEWRQSHNLWQAVGHYHSHNPQEAHRYVVRVQRWYHRILWHWNNVIVRNN